MFQKLRVNFKFAQEQSTGIFTDVMTEVHKEIARVKQDSAEAMEAVERCHSDSKIALPVFKAVESFSRTVFNTSLTGTGIVFGATIQAGIFASSLKNGPN